MRCVVKCCEWPVSHNILCPAFSKPALSSQEAAWILLLSVYLAAARKPQATVLSADWQSEVGELKSHGLHTFSALTSVAAICRKSWGSRHEATSLPPSVLLSCWLPSARGLCRARLLATRHFDAIYAVK